MEEKINFILNNPEFKEALLNPEIIEESIQDIPIINSSLTFPMLICDNPDTELPAVPNQLNFVLPLSIRKSKEPYAVNIRNDLNMYRKLYEKYSKQVNFILDKTKSCIKNLYQPLKKLREDIKKYVSNFSYSLSQLKVPLENKKKGLNQINYKKFPESAQKSFLKEREEILNEINNFIKTSETFFQNYEKLNANTRYDLDIFVKKFMQIPEPAKDLSTFMRSFFKNFEKSHKNFDDLNNKKKVEEALQKIKEPIDEFGRKSKDIEEKLKVIEDLEKNKKIENMNDYVTKINSTMEELEKKSNLISQKIADIRKKYNEPDENLEKMKNTQVTSLILDESSKILAEQQNSVIEQTNSSIQKIVEDLNNIKLQTRLDLLFIMDITNSMDIYLNQVKSGIYEMISAIKKECAGIEIYLGFIGYRDFSDLDFGEEYINLEFTTDYEKIKNNIAYVKAEGGGDIPEDLCGAFEFAKFKDWKGKSRFAILVTDSPCHGTKYHDLTGEQGDNYPEGDRNGRNIEDFVKYFSENEISLFCLKISSYTEKMFGIFKDIYYKNKKPDSNNQFFVGEAKKLFDFVTQNAVKTFQNRKNLEI